MAAQALLRSEIAGKVEQFFEYLQVEKGCSPLTIRNYRHYLNRLINWLGNQAKPKGY